MFVICATKQVRTNRSVAQKEGLAAVPKGTGSMKTTMDGTF